MVKLDALREFERRGGDAAASCADSEVPSVLLRSTGKSGLSRSLIAGSKRVPDPVDDFIAMKRAELGLKPVPSANDTQKKPRKMGLNEFLRRFTSEDNASFQELHEMDQERFRQKIAWMFKESEQYKTLQALAGSEPVNAEQPKLLADDDGKLRTVAAIKFVENDAQPNIFFREPGEDQARARELFK